jgi:hypothetical protein
LIYGYHEGFLKFSWGAQQSTEKAYMLRHWASSTNGWSGTPLIQDGFVVGVHTGGDQSLRENLATTCFWLKLVSKETPNPDHEDKDVYVQGFTEEQERRLQKSSYRYNDKTFVVENYGRNIRISEAFNTGLDWNAMDDDPYAMADNHFYESGFPTQVAPALPVKKTAVKEMSSGDSLDGRGKDFGKVKKNRNSNRARSSKKNRILASGSSGKQEDTESKKERPTLKESASKKSVDARITQQERELSVLRKHLQKLVPSGTLLESGITLPVTLPPNSVVCDCKPRDSSVLIPLLTRKQEKLYNKICHTRKYQQALKDQVDISEPHRSLRARTLAYVMCSTTVLRENPLQDFLSTL